jgi:flavin reductase (DIM6/NTAB) family NADH-FMN oxidoreductase RutF
LRQDYEEFRRRDAEVLAIAPDTVHHVRMYSQKHALPFPVLADERHAIYNRYGVQNRLLSLGQRPGFFVVDKAGTVRYAYLGTQQWEIPPNPTVFKQLDALQKEEGILMDPEVRKRVLRLLTYGLYILTAAGEGEVAAGTVNWLSQASFTPPLVVVAVKVNSRLHDLIDRSRAFAVNILGASQKEVASAFFRPTQVEDGRINGYAFEPGPQTGAPLLIDLPAWFEARVRDVVKRGDHTVFVAEVIEAGLRDPQAKPLEMWDTGWFYGG